MQQVRMCDRSHGLLLAAAAGCTSVIAVQLLTDSNPIGRCFRFWRQLGRQQKNLTCANNVDSGVTNYAKFHDECDTETRTSSYRSLVNSYYDLVTVFYEWGWGSSFHFAYRYCFETFDEAIRRHEYMLASQLRVFGAPNVVLDVGCGIGGPGRNISRFLQVQVKGVTLNPYQVRRGNELNEKDKLSNMTAVQGDFMNLPFEEAEFDACYAIDATCHAPDRVACFKQIYKVLKPGAIFATFEWCTTDKLQPGNAEHERIKMEVQQGNGLPDVCSTEECSKALRDAGFEMVTEFDLATVESFEPWYAPFYPSWNIFSQRFQFTWLGAKITNACIWTLETLRLVPAGTIKTQRVLQKAVFSLPAAGKLGIYTTMYMMVGKKPERQ